VRADNKIVEQLLSKDPALRFASATEVSQLLEQCLSHLQQPSSVSLPASLVPHAAGRRSIFNVTRKAVIAMLGTIGVTLLGMVLWLAPEAPDISGQWTSEEWGTVVLEAKQPGQYQGTMTDALLQITHERGKTGTIELKWSPLERRFNGTFQTSHDLSDPWYQPPTLSGKLSIRLVDDEGRARIAQRAFRKGSPKQKWGPALLPAPTCTELRICRCSLA
jgi:hypothetical protein